jgi:uncharacterized membrane protein
MDGRPVGGFMMTADRMLLTLKIISALGCGLTAGVLLAFSSFIMNALSPNPSVNLILGRLFSCG